MVVREKWFNIYVLLELWKVCKHSLDTQMKESYFKNKAQC